MSGPGGGGSSTTGLNRAGDPRDGEVAFEATPVAWASIPSAVSGGGEAASVAWKEADRSRET